jgi:hypothetical protein
MRASGWRPHASGTLQGFFNLRLPSGLVLNDFTLHQKGERRWVGLPGKPQIDAEDRVRRDPTTGKRLYTPAVEIPAREVRDKFQEQALAAVDRMLRTGGAP